MNVIVSTGHDTLDTGNVPPLYTYAKTLGKVIATAWAY